MIGFSTKLTLWDFDCCCWLRLDLGRDFLSRVGSRWGGVCVVSTVAIEEVEGDWESAACKRSNGVIIWLLFLPQDLRHSQRPTILSMSSKSQLKSMETISVDLYMSIEEKIMPTHIFFRHFLFLEYQCSFL